VAAPASSAHVALGRAVRELRTQRRISQEELALLSDLQRKTIHQLEAAKVDPRYGSLRRVAEALGLRIVDVVMLADELELRAAGQGGPGRAKGHPALRCAAGAARARRPSGP
jgi:transcriptional regulator with XRE-family HTH domain